jgi:hypothetical protein
MLGRTGARSRIPWWAWIVAGDVVLLAVIWFGGYWPRTPVSRAILSWLAVHQENNLAVWWSAAQLLLGSLLMYERASVGRADERWPWAVLAGVSAGLSLDEVGSIHERLANRSWRPLLLVAVPFGIALAWALARLARKPERRREVALIVGAYGLFGGVVGLEYLESIVGWTAPPGMAQALEEGAELLGFLLLLFAAAGHRSGGLGDLWSVIPDPGRFGLLRSVLTLSFVPHAVIALFVAHHLMDLWGRGNPIVWYPFAVYGLLVCQAVTVRDEDSAGARRAWRWLAGFFLICSIGAVFALTKLTPYIDRVLPRWVHEGPYATYLLVVPPVLLLAGRVLGWGHRRLHGVVALLTVLILVRLPGPIWWLDALTPGLIVYLWAFLLTPPDLARVVWSAKRRSEPRSAT